MRIEDIHIHDSKIISVVEYPDVDDLVFEVNYPVDWDNNVFEHRFIVFHDFLNYSIKEGPFHGGPVLLDACPKGGNDGRSMIDLHTNAGRRSLEYSSVDLVSEYKKAQQNGAGQAPTLPESK